MKPKYTEEYSNNLIGKKINALTYVKFSHRANDSNAFGIWKCDCGKEITARIADVVLNRKKSCNCFRLRKKENNSQWTGYKDITGNYWGIVKKGAIQRNLEFTITIEYIWDLFIKQNKKCALSGIELCWPTRCKAGDGTASLDRIDSKKGYVYGNVQWVHKTINCIKRDLSDDEFIDWCRKVTMFQVLKN